MVIITDTIVEINKKKKKQLIKHHLISYGSKTNFQILVILVLKDNNCLF